MIIFTPTFNRADKLQELYQSLLAQTNTNFIWLIVDDGSTDNTAQLVKKWKTNSPFVINYLYQENQGKHIAYNTAIDTMSKDDVHIVVDSDDILTKTAIDTFYRDLDNTDEYIGIVYPKFEKNTDSIDWVGSDIQHINIPDLKNQYGLSVETCIVVKNQYIKGFRFPQFENEKYMSEEVLYVFLQKQGYFKPLYCKVYLWEYLEQGITRNLFKIWQRDILGTLYFLREREKYITQQITGISKYRELLKVKLNINALQLCNNKINNFNDYSLVDYLLLPASFIWKWWRFK